ncbi:MAG TPA: 3-phosphoserine/phosphohydroxythreonine transaminase [Acidobacteriota bacterium]|jgi:phosphoserine aminotransferase|nr:3-phosphoserine/phosphohydroxythreonine transaminase [Acidobacteriota bacterium]HNT17281.1 3-phosphoserine/phosphohydroxythreonine transaminase [Acidobacteriota bacterium]HPA26344.1 3-phosphoserine/phosphohydroxythreonine transaminase [Acidobacteriota bacterium]HQO19760.1 3-phosphoserine/phosphohydroxythreonine transaminase [Acidobacteriota bacterium]HQQ46326.1 3-phosphoserine/phosphohydroxythreonine transaminase [Acidobacteriota bacterium]
MARKINFYAGPAGLPLPALERAQKELLDFENTGMSVMEISHRSKEYDKVHNEAIELTRELLGVPDNYKIMLLQGGGNLQFAMLPMNILHGGKKADYIVTGQWAKKAFKEAKIVAGDNARCVCNMEGEKFNRLPRPEEIKINPDAAYVHICSNNTIFGTQWKNWPDTKGIPLCADMSSDIMWRPIDVKDFAFIYAGAQKNLGPSGLVVAIMRNDFLEMCSDKLPSMLQYRIHADKNSLYNTPPCFSIYILRNVLAYNKSIGGLGAIYKNNLKKGELLYGCIDKHADFYKPFVAVKEDRSYMNINFFLPTEELTTKFIDEAKKNNMVGVKGYRDVGGIRISAYNAVSVSDIEALVSFMEDFVKKSG